MTGTALRSGVVLIGLAACAQLDFSGVPMDYANTPIDVELEIDGVTLALGPWTWLGETVGAGETSGCLPSLQLQADDGTGEAPEGLTLYFPAPTVQGAIGLGPTRFDAFLQNRVPIGPDGLSRHLVGGSWTLLTFTADRVVVTSDDAQWCDTLTHDEALDGLLPSDCEPAGPLRFTFQSPGGLPLNYLADEPPPTCDNGGQFHLEDGASPPLCDTRVRTCPKHPTDAAP
jgi:hypothetical protein